MRLDETFDLRAKGAERFVAFLTDRTFKLTLDEAQIEWGEPVMKGAVLYELAKLGTEEAVFLEVRGGKDRLIDPGESIDLAEPGIERFITAPKAAATFEIIVNSRPKTCRIGKVTFEQIVQLAFPGQHAANVVFSMTYRHAASKPYAGELGKGRDRRGQARGGRCSMSPRPFSRSPDLKRLRDEGYFVQIRGGLLIMREVPYVNERREVLTGGLISSLNMAGDQTQTPDTHCRPFRRGLPLRRGRQCNRGHRPSQSQQRPRARPRGATPVLEQTDGGYADYHHKMTSYANILSGPAEVLKPGVSPASFPGARG